MSNEKQTTIDLKTYFENNHDCYADTGTGGKVVLAMTFTKFEKAVSEWENLKLSEQACKQWIKVDTKPKRNIEVIVSDEVCEWVCCGYWNGKNWYNQFESRNGGDVPIYPTHWMPLPEQPKND